MSLHSYTDLLGLGYSPRFCTSNVLGDADVTGMDFITVGSRALGHWLHFGVIVNNGFGQESLLVLNKDWKSLLIYIYIYWW